MATHIFDPNEGEWRLADAIERVDANAPVSWMTVAAKIARNLTGEWTTDDVWRELDRLGIEPPHEPRAMGAITRALSHAGLIAKTGRTVKSERAECHRRDITVWLTVGVAGEAA